MGSILERSCRSYSDEVCLSKEFDFLSRLLVLGWAGEREPW